METMTEPLEMSQMLWAMASLSQCDLEAFPWLLQGLAERPLSSQQLAGMAWACGKTLWPLPDVAFTCLAEFTERDVAIRA